MHAAPYMRKRNFLKNLKFGSVVLESHYVTCFNASVLRYTTLLIYFTFKIYSWENNRPNSVLITLYRTAHASFKI